ncbi:MAG: polymer-forming cytoskeletal protein [Gammaproteobacteria bacterium]|nr:polymer-forming cytoskeletal protein [Gammaproteobacteria bacterium]MCW8841145.1 polymer-forming cytoskeletal protein [Gammaproteobacteria bacterium]MCW8927628.1 polymer-forming cytoskeletal protein [Gammaproteobacteria bacterium]MCW8957630.1 polymer-forming cytoskeletal protein [Gammaproteobacteria bacterium]MCW8973001.1 polymer-forming cytoskeletal protein [Gammaproteobacteria bacterium]
MFSRKKDDARGKRTKIDTLIGQNSELRGDVVFSGGLHVDGVIQGNVYAEGDSGSTLSVSERGLIEGEVRVPNIVLNGSVKGDVHAAEHIELAKMARVTGNVYYKLIEMARGAEVNGNLVHRASGAEQELLPSPAEKEAAQEEEVNT